MMQRNRALPWFIGLAIIVIAEGIALLVIDEGPAEFYQEATLLGMPILLLAIMFLMFKSQK